MDRVFQSSKVICVWQIVSNQWFVYDACLTNSHTVHTSLQNFVGQTGTFPSRGQRIYSKFTFASYGNKMRQTELKTSVSLPPSKQLLSRFVYWCYVIISHLFPFGRLVVKRHHYPLIPCAPCSGKSRFDLIYILYILTVSTLLPFTLYTRQLRGQ